MKKRAKEAKEKGKKMLKQVKKGASDAAKVIVEVTKVEEAEKVEEAAELVDFLDEYEEDTYEEANPAEYEPSMEEIDTYLMKHAKDAETFARDKDHMIHFNNPNVNLGSRMMKGRGRYLKRLRAFVNGDTSVKIRMMDNRERSVASLKPNVEHLKSLLNMDGVGARFCKCNC